MKVCLKCGRRFTSPEWTCPACAHRPPAGEGWLVFDQDGEKGGECYKPEYFGRLASLEERHFWFRARNALLVWAVRRYFPGAATLLELGCGTGMCLAGMRAAFPDLALFGGDIYGEGLRFARARIPSASFFQVDARRLPFDEEFDVVGAFDMIEHIDDDVAVLQQMRQAAKPGGGVVVTVPQHPSLWTSVDRAALHKRRYSRAELADKATQAGLQVVRMTSFVSLLMPLMILSRRRDYTAKGTIDIEEFLRVNPIVNFVLERIMGLERQLIRAGVSWPAGGSLLLVAKRPER